MKHFFLLIMIVLTIHSASFSQTNITRGAIPGELYLTGLWYGIYDPYWGEPNYDTLRTAVFRLIENGKCLTIQYDTDYFANIELVMQPQIILADATQGVVYSRNTYSKNSYEHTQFWVSFDSGKNWTSIEENIGRVGYFAAGLDAGVLYRGGENRAVLQSRNFGESFEFLFTVPIPYSTKEIGYQECEFFGFGNSYHDLQYTNDCANTFTIIPIDTQYVFGQIWGIFPDVYRGGVPGEVYVSSMFPEGDHSDPFARYKVSFSADTGYTFRHVYVSDTLEAGISSFPFFMSDREPGVFYILHSYQIEDKDPAGWHKKICVEYYRDYGATLVDTYCHELTKDYKNGLGVKGVKELEGVRVWPNPTAGELRVKSEELRVESVEVYDIYGRKVLEQKAEGRKQNENSPPFMEGWQPQADGVVMDISHLPAGIYFVRVAFESGSCVKKLVKQ